MFGEALDRLNRDIDTGIAAIRVAAATRSALVNPAPRTGRLRTIRELAPSSDAWASFDQAAAFNWSYAAFERFVFEVASRWVAILPSMYGPYLDLPEATRTAHRRGVAEILPRLTNPRYAHLSEPAVLRGLYMGASGQVPYELLVDAFLTDDRNLRSDTVKSLLSSLGVENGWSALVADRALVRWLQTERGPQATVESELNQFVAHRNEAAHGSAAAVLEPDDLVKYAEFARRLGVAIGDLIVGEAIAREVALGQAEEIGEVIREFSENVIGCRMKACTVRVGETLLVIDSRSGHEVEVESLEINGTPHDEVDCTDGLEVGLKVTKSAREGATLVRRVERDDTEVGPAGAPQAVTTVQET